MSPQKHIKPRDILFEAVPGKGHIKVRRVMKLQTLASFMTLYLVEKGFYYNVFNKVFNQPLAGENY